MWGDPERASSMEQGRDPLATLLFQISSPAHIPWGDQRWQEVLHGYDVWVHMDESNQLMEQACKSMAKHAELSSNLASLSLHVTRLLRDLAKDFRTRQSVENDQVDEFSKRISRVAKARATAGGLQLLRMLSHTLIAEASKDPESSMGYLREVFTYHTRGDLLTDQPSGFPLLHALLDWISVLGTPQPTTTTSPNPLKTPEVYDCAVFSLQLLFVLCGTQLYQPFRSSFEINNSPCHYFLDELYKQQHDDKDSDNSNPHLELYWSSTRSVGSNSTRSHAGGSSLSSARRKRTSKFQKRKAASSRRKIWTHKVLFETLLEWQLHRPKAPDRSIAHYYYVLAHTAVTSSEKPGPDGLYENYKVVQAISPNSEDPEPSFPNGNEGPDEIPTATGRENGVKRNNIIVDTTKGILTLSGSIIFLPFRLMSLFYGVFSNGKAQDKNREAMMKKFAAARYSRTRDVLWLSESLLADLGCSLILFLANNQRSKPNAFRLQLQNLKDNRWNSETWGEQVGLVLPDLPNLGGETNDGEPQGKVSSDGPALTLNFESLFASFGRTLHTELGALLLYTILQSSPSFAESLAVRSDMDNLAMPLLRSLYFASSTNAFMAKDFAHQKRSVKHASTPSLDIRSCPFRTQSQLYVIVILLLLFSQDSSFGRDSFRRVFVISVPWYKERNLKHINLGSVIVLTLLRTLLFSLNRFRDAFLLNNCCAVLENISPSVADLHEYAAMRLVSVTVSVMKKHAKLVQEEASKASESHLDMHEEVAHTLIGLIKNGLSVTNIEGNLHLIYALVYHQVDWMRLTKTKYAMGGTTKKKKLYHSIETSRINGVILKASELIREEGARSAPKALKLIEQKLNDLRAVVVNDDQETRSKVSSSKKSVANGENNPEGANGSTLTEEEFTFSYEEEADPEVFFVPYLWDIIVSVVTASNIEWKKEDIQAFELLETEVEENGTSESMDLASIPGKFSNDAEEMV